MPEQENSDLDSTPTSENRFDRIVRRSEEIVFTVFIFGMIFIGLLPIALRYFSSTGITWPEPLSRHMVLWIALLGASTAVRDRSNIAIDVVSHLLQERKRLFIRGFSELFSACVCGILIWVSISFVQSSFEYERDAIAFLWVREWCLTIALPLGFTLLTVRLLIASAQDIVKSFKTPKNEPKMDMEDS